FKTEISAWFYLKLLFAQPREGNKHHKDCILKPSKTSIKKELSNERPPFVARRPISHIFYIAHDSTKDKKKD
ncbi:hypothetical protein, partial [Streptococcus iniae]